MVPSATQDAIDEERRIRESLRVAEEHKSEGNDYFRSARWDEALGAYRTGLGRLPKRNERTVEAGNVEEGGQTNEEHVDRGNAQPPECKTELDLSCAKARAILHANIGACYVKLNEHENAVQACTQSLFDDPHYVKALERRAASNETINSWTSLTSAQEDYTTLLEILPASSPQIGRIRQSVDNLRPRVEAAQKRETAEMLGKLKGLGNSILGKFGLSTDNFKFEPNGQGGYSMNLSQ